MRQNHDCALGPQLLGLQCILRPSRDKVVGRWEPLAGSEGPPRVDDANSVADCLGQRDQRNRYVDGANDDQGRRGLELLYEHLAVFALANCGKGAAPTWHRRDRGLER